MRPALSLLAPLKVACNRIENLGRRECLVGRRDGRQDGRGDETGGTARVGRHCTFTRQGFGGGCQVGQVLF